MLQQGKHRKTVENNKGKQRSNAQRNYKSPPHHHHRTCREGRAQRRNCYSTTMLEPKIGSGSAQQCWSLKLAASVSGNG